MVALIINTSALAEAEKATLVAGEAPVAEEEAEAVAEEAPACQRDVARTVVEGPLVAARLSAVPNKLPPLDLLP